jgi:hypothetical protein
VVRIKNTLDLATVIVSAPVLQEVVDQVDVLGSVAGLFD